MIFRTTCTASAKRAYLVAVDFAGQNVQRQFSKISANDSLIGCDKHFLLNYSISFALPTNRLTLMPHDANFKARINAEDVCFKFAGSLEEIVRTKTNSRRCSKSSFNSAHILTSAQQMQLISRCSSSSL